MNNINYDEVIITKEFRVGSEEEELLRNGNTLVYGDRINEYVIMTYSKYVSLVTEGAVSKIKERLQVEKT